VSRKNIPSVPAAHSHAPNFSDSAHCCTVPEPPMKNDMTKALGALRVDEMKLRRHVHEVVRLSVEGTLNALLDAEADKMCGTQRYERSPRQGRYASRALRGTLIGPALSVRIADFS